MPYPEMHLSSQESLLYLHPSSDLDPEATFHGKHPVFDLCHQVPSLPQVLISFENLYWAIDVGNEKRSHFPT